MGCGHHPTNHSPPSPQQPPTTNTNPIIPTKSTPPQNPIVISLFPNLYPNFKTKPCIQLHISVLPNCTSHFHLTRYRDVVLAFSLYKLVSDRRIWTPIKPRFDEGIKELR